MADRLMWFSAPDGVLGFDHENEHAVARVIAVETGWDVWIFDLFCGTYLTREMAIGAAGGLYRITVDGSSLPRWTGPGHG